MLGYLSSAEKCRAFDISHDLLGEVWLGGCVGDKVLASLEEVVVFAIFPSGEEVRGNVGWFGGVYIALFGFCKGDGLVAEECRDV